MTKGYFVTGTDTGIGKTTVALALMSALQKKGFKVTAMKPVSAGCELTDEGLRNDDAVSLMQQASVELPYHRVNPYAFEPAIAPHIAADATGVVMQREPVLAEYNNIKKQSEFVIVEGAGGWLVPINEKETMADVASSMELPVLLVVGLRLGCLNHALLTQESINHMGLTLAGWVANHITEDFPGSTENIKTLERRLQAPMLGIIPYTHSPAPDDVAGRIDISKLL